MTRSRYQISRTKNILLAEATMQEMNKEDETIRSNSGKMHIAIITCKLEQLLTIYDSEVIQTSEGDCAAYHIAEKKDKKKP
jgi:hypothetical protein